MPLTVIMLKAPLNHVDLGNSKNIKLRLQDPIASLLI